MSNYTIAVPWSGKDALSDSDPAKVISGSDFNTEFSAVQTAVNTKANLNGSASESFSATTAAVGTNTTQSATTAFVKVAIDAIPTVDLSAVYPVGAIFTTVTAYANSAAVAATLGGTTWVAFAAGKMLIGLDSSDTDFDTVEETGGAKTHTLTEAEMPAHTHSYDAHLGTGSAGPISLHDRMPLTTSSTTSTGGGVAHNNMPPYIAVYMWKRTA